MDNKRCKFFDNGCPETNEENCECICLDCMEECDWDEEMCI